MNKPNVYKRILAYTLDILLIYLVATLLSYIIPKNDSYDEALKKINEATISYRNGDIEIEDYTNIYNENNYTLEKNNILETVIIITVTILYFGVYVFFNDGQTLGKRIMKIKVISVNDKKLTINNYLIRLLLINSVLQSIASLVLIFVLTKTNYIFYNDKLINAFGVFYIANFVLILFRSDGRGIHDLICNTKVVNSDYVPHIDDEIKVVRSSKDIKNKKIKVVEGEVKNERV